jgi:hypothetical protein
MSRKIILSFTETLRKRVQSCYVENNTVSNTLASLIFRAMLLSVTLHF